MAESLLLCISDLFMSQFDDLSLNELMVTRTEIDKLIKIRQKEVKNELLRDFKQKAESVGIDFNELIAPAQKAASKKSPKYRNPTNEKETWSGRGRQPQWVQEELSKGRKLEDLAIG